MNDNIKQWIRLPFIELFHLTLEDYIGFTFYSLKMITNLVQGVVRLCGWSRDICLR